VRRDGATSDMDIGMSTSKGIPQQLTITVDKHLSLDMVAIHAYWMQGGEEKHLQSVLTGRSFLEIGPQSVALIVHNVLQEYVKGVPSSEKEERRL
jgi:hypothetical protein